MDHLHGEQAICAYTFDYTYEAVFERISQDLLCWGTCVSA
jgi:hypothetical protein